MLNNLQYGIKIPIDTSSLVIFSDRVAFTIQTIEQLEQIAYTNKEVILIDNEYNKYSGHVLSSSSTGVEIAVDNIPSVKYIFLGDKVYSGNYIKNSTITKVEMFGQRFENAYFNFGVKLNFNRPRYTKIYKYCIKFINVYEEFSILYSETPTFIIPQQLININKDFIFKVACYYKNSKQTDITDYSELVRFNMNTITYE